MVPTPASGVLNLVTGPDDQLWFTEVTGNKIGRVSTDGLFSEFGLPTSGSDPRGIAHGHDDNLWITEFAGNKIARVTRSGQPTEFAVPTRASGPVFINRARTTRCGSPN